MAPRKIKSKSRVTIELWETSIRVPGASAVMSIGKDFKDEQVIQFVDAIYDTIYERVRKDALNDLADESADQARGAVLKIHKKY